jgi:hypothetical protein
MKKEEGMINPFNMIGYCDVYHHTDVPNPNPTPGPNLGNDPSLYMANYDIQRKRLLDAST